MSWVRYAGRVMCIGDSITRGYGGLTGGWRAGLTASLASAGIGATFVGPASDTGSHRGVDGARATTQTSQLQTDCATYLPAVAIVSYGMNDMGNDVAPSSYLAALRTCIGWVRAGSPGVRVLVVSSITPTIDAAADYGLRRAAYATAKAGLGPLCTDTGCALLDIEAAGPIETSDGIHPVDGATGYDLMATRTHAALLALLPGG